jgi:hypothetical protein
LHLFGSRHVRISPLVTLALALVVWLIYVADRLLDGLRTDALARLPARHQFYRDHRAALACLLLGILVVTCCICLELDARTLELGTLLMLAVVCYFAVVHSMRTQWGVRFPKEMVVALLFGIGTIFPVWIHTLRANSLTAIGWAFFVVICWLNLVLIEYAEWIGLRDRSSEAPHRSSIAAGKRLPIVCGGVALIALSLSALSVTTSEHGVLLAVTLSALALAALGLYWRKLSIHAVRVLADATLLTPAVILLFLHN